MDIDGSAGSNPFITFNSQDLDNKDIDTFLEDFAAVGDMLHVSSKDSDYYAFGNITGINATTRQVFISGYTSEGTLAQNSTVVSVNVAKRGDTGGAESGLYYDSRSPSDATNPGALFGGPSENPINKIRIYGDGDSGGAGSIQVTAQRQVGDGESGEDSATFFIQYTGDSTPTVPGQGQYITHISRLGYDALDSSSDLRSCTFDNSNAPSSFNGTFRASGVDSSISVGKSSPLNGGVIIPFPIFESGSADGGQGGDAIDQNNVGNSAITNAQTGALGSGFGAIPQYITGTLFADGTDASNGEFDANNGQGGGLKFLSNENQGYRVIRYDITLQAVTGAASGVGFAVMKASQGSDNTFSRFNVFAQSGQLGYRGTQPGELTNPSYGVSDSDTISVFKGLTHDTREVNIEVFDSNTGTSAAYYLVAYPLGQDSPRVLGGKRTGIIVESLNITGG